MIGGRADGTRNRTRSASDLYAQSGPFASAYVEVSKDMESGNQIVELTAREAADALTGAGAPQSVADQLSEPLSASTHQLAPISRLVVASEAGVLFERLARAHRAQPAVSWSPLPDVAAWLADLQQVRPFILALMLGAAPLDASLRADLALVAAACLTSARLVISPSRTLGGAPMAALLRWDG